MSLLSTESVIVFLVGGQGSQYFGMASSLYHGNAEFRCGMDRLDAQCRERNGFSVLDYIYDPTRGLADPCDDLTRSSAAIFAVEYALSQVLRAEGITPTLSVGSSLGEFVAMSVAGYVPVDAALDFVVAMARAVESFGPAGGMLAVLGDPELYRTMPALHRNTEMASVNHAGHFVLTGGPAGLSAANAALTGLGLVTVSLPVRFAFHSSALESIRTEIERLATPIAFDVAEPGFISSAVAGPVTRLDGQLCWRILRDPIDFTGAVTTVPDSPIVRYIDLTPSGTLSVIMKGSHPARRVHPVITPFGNELANLRRIRAEVLT